ncbi:MAG: hypothetical protein FJX03_05050 [Alphaproteobacteria bacterium]|nr:hypothetical protein [Alphaproteobacteria bacterium]
MSVTKNSKLGRVLLATTVMAALFGLPEAGHGLDRLAKQQAAQKQEHAALQARTLDGVQDPVKFLNTVNDPIAALRVPAANGNLSDIFNKAIAVAGSTAAVQLAAVRLPAAAAITPAMKAKVFEAIRTSANPADSEIKNSIKTALGLDHSAASDPYLEMFTDEAVEATIMRDLLRDLGGRTKIAKIESLLARLNAGTHKANDGTPVAAGVANNISRALNRLGL